MVSVPCFEVVFCKSNIRFRGVVGEFKIYDATVAKTSLKIASSSLSNFFIIRELKTYDATAAITPQILHV